MITKNNFDRVLEQFNKIDPILVIGDIGIDKYTKGEVTRISPEAPVPVVEVFQEWNKLGLAANVTDNLNELDVKSTICGVIGNDHHGNLLESLLEENGLSTWGVVRSSSRKTTFKERVVTSIQQICRIDYESKQNIDDETNDRIYHRIDEFIDVHSAVIFEDYGKGLFTKELTAKMTALAKEHKKFVAVDPSRTTDPLFYKGVDLLKPNRVESELMVKLLGYQETDIAKISEILMDKLELSKLIITLGAEGMAVTDRDAGGKMLNIPTVAREVFDVSGAGDTAISAIVASLVAGATLEEAAWIGNCASAVVVGKKGTALVNKDELSKTFNELMTIAQ